MADSKSVSCSGPGLGLFTVLTIVFVVLKLTPVIDWSWWLVLLPAIIGAGFWLLGMLIVLLTVGLAAGRRY